MVGARSAGLAAARRAAVPQGALRAALLHTEPAIESKASRILAGFGDATLTLAGRPKPGVIDETLDRHGYRGALLQLHKAFEEGNDDQLPESLKEDYPTLQALDNPLKSALEFTDNLGHRYGLLVEKVRDYPTFWLTTPTNVASCASRAKLIEAYTTEMDINALLERALPFLRSEAFMGLLICIQSLFDGSLPVMKAILGTNIVQAAVETFLRRGSWDCLVMLFRILPTARKALLRLASDMEGGDEVCSARYYRMAPRLTPTLPIGVANRVLERVARLPDRTVFIVLWDEIKRQGVRMDAATFGHVATWCLLGSGGPLRRDLGAQCSTSSLQECEAAIEEERRVLMEAATEQATRAHYSLPLSSGSGAPLPTPVGAAASALRGSTRPKEFERPNNFIQRLLNDSEYHKHAVWQVVEGHLKRYNLVFRSDLKISSETADALSLAVCSGDHLDLYKRLLVRRGSTMSGGVWRSEWAMTAPLDRAIRVALDAVSDLQPPPCSHFCLELCTMLWKRIVAATPDGMNGDPLAREVQVVSALSSLFVHVIPERTLQGLVEAILLAFKLPPLLAVPLARAAKAKRYGLAHSIILHWLSRESEKRLNWKEAIAALEVIHRSGYAGRENILGGVLCMAVQQGKDGLSEASRLALRMAIEHPRSVSGLTWRRIFVAYVESGAMEDGHAFYCKVMAARAKCTRTAPIAIIDECTVIYGKLLLTKSPDELEVYCKGPLFPLALRGADALAVALRGLTHRQQYKHMVALLSLACREHRHIVNIKHYSLALRGAILTDRKGSGRERVDGLRRLMVESGHGAPVDAIAACFAGGASGVSPPLEGTFEHQHGATAFLILCLVEGGITQFTENFFHLYNCLLQPTLEVVSLFLEIHANAASEEGQEEEMGSEWVRSFLAWMRSRNVEPDAVTYSRLLALGRARRQVGIVNAVVEEMQKNMVHLSRSICLQMLPWLSSDGRAEAGEALFASMVASNIAPDNVFYNEIAKIAIAQGNLERALHWIQASIEARRLVSQGVVRDFLLAYEQAVASEEDFARVLAHFRRGGLFTHLEVYEGLLERSVNNGHVQSALESFRTAKRKSSVIQSSLGIRLIALFMEHGLVYDAHQVYREMVRRNKIVSNGGARFDPPWSSFEALLDHHYGKEGGSRGAGEEGCQPLTVPLAVPGIEPPREVLEPLNELDPLSEIEPIQAYPVALFTWACRRGRILPSEWCSSFVRNCLIEADFDLARQMQLYMATHGLAIAAGAGDRVLSHWARRASGFVAAPPP